MKKLLSCLLLALMLVTPLLGAASLATAEPTIEVTETPATEVTEQPTTEQPTTEEPATEEPTTEEPTTEQPTTEQPTTEQPTTEQPTTEEPTTEQPATEQPATEQPTTEQPATEQPTTEQPTTEQPVTEEVVAEEAAIMLASEDGIAAQSDGCAHECVTVDEDYMYGDYTPVDAYAHSLDVTVVTTEICKACGEVVSEVTRTETITEKHYFADGVCEDCGYEYDCPHKTTYKESGMVAGNWSCKPVDANTHIVTYNSAEWTICASCGDIIDETIEEGVSETEPHTFNSEGVCSVCEFEDASQKPSACAHENTAISFYYDSDPSSCESNGADGHTRVYTRNYAIRCLDCGSYINDQEENISEMESHSFVDGVCTECGYRNVCEHKFQSSDEYMTDKMAYYQDETSHVLRYRLATVVSCDTCGEVLSTTKSDEWQTKVEAHKYGTGKDDACLCGCYFNSGLGGCAHENVSTETNMIDILYGKGDQNGHTIYYREATVTTCDDCNNWISEAVTRGERLSKIEPHVIEDGVCRICGYKEETACAHEDVEESTTVSEGNYTFVDHYAHSRDETTVTTKTCKTCGEVLSTETSTKTYTDKHSFEDGVCEYCGYEYDCPHETKITAPCEWDDYDVEPVDENTHRVTYIVYEDTHCAYCGEELGVSSGQEYSATEPHVFDSEGVCRECGYEDADKACTHENAITTVSYDENVSYKAVDADGHIHTCTRVYAVYCPDCDDVVEGYEKELSEKESHSFENGVCVDCGYANACAHEIQDSYEDMADRVYYYQDDASHAIRYHSVKVVYCVICNEVLSETKSNEWSEITQPHVYDFSDKGFSECQCGDVILGHTHENIDTYNYITDYLVEKGDENGHTISCRYGVDTYCADCGLLLYTEITPDERVTEIMPHEFENGVCRVCGYKLNSTPTMPIVTDDPIEPTPTPTTSASTDTTKTSTDTESDDVFSEVPADMEVHGVKVADNLKIVETMIRVADSVESTPTTIEILYANKVLTADELAALEDLPLEEQLLTFLSAIGFEEQVNRAIDAGQTMLSDPALALKDAVLARVAAMDEAARSEFDTLLQTYFPKTTENGYTCFTIDLEATTDGIANAERYTFREEGDDWIFTLLQITG